MKKLLYGICFLLVLSLFIILTQISCQKSVAQRNPSAQETSVNLILLAKGKLNEVSLPSNGVDSLGQPIIKKVTSFSTEYYVMNTDGSNLTKIPINLPAGLYVISGGHLTPDGKSIVFNVIDSLLGGYVQEVKSYIYSCSLDGSNLKKLIDGSYDIRGVY